MKKHLLSITGILLLTACATNNNVPIRSATQPVPYTETTFYDDSYDDVSTNQTTTETTTTTTTETTNTDDTTSINTTNTTTTNQTTTETTTQNVDVKNTAFGAMGNYKIGNPYLIDGVSYYPHEDYTYSEIGIASWYGPDFHGGKTSNGETFDENKLTAAHRTLPMPSLVRVTNLENGTSVNVKINDRGPYARDRILDLSSAAADILGIKAKGSARVKVEILPEESKKLKELAISSQNTDIYPPDVKYSSVNVAPIASAPAEPTPITPIEKDTQSVETPAPQQTSATTGDYYVQVGAYSTYDKADSMKNKLSHIGTVKIFKSVVNGNTLYKVRLGEFTTKEEAEKIQQEITNNGIEGSRVILKEDGSFKWKL